MVQYKVLLKPELLKPGMKNSDKSIFPDYGYRKIVRLTQPASQVYLRRIRFNIVIDHVTLNTKLVFQPYQFHIRWMDDYKRIEQESGVMLNSLYHYDTGYIGVEPTDAYMDPSYSTFCTLHKYVHFIREPNADDPSGSELYEGNNDFYYYDMERNDLIRDERIWELNFEAFFTNVGGKRYYRNMPNIELDFEVL